MEIFLLILKIIGITLLAIICLILAAVLMLLFVPIRYSVTLSNKQEDGRLYARAKAVWLLHFVNALVSYYEELYYRVRIIVFNIASSDKKEKKRHTEKSKNKEDDEADEADKLYVTDEQPDKPQNEDLPAISCDDSAGADNAGDTNDAGDADDTEMFGTPEDFGEEDEQKLFDKIKEIIQKLLEIIFNLPDKITSVIEKINDIKHNTDYYIRAVNDERNQEAFSRCLGELARIFKSMAPKKIKGEIIIGRTDPYDYGQACSILGIAYPFIHDKIKTETFDDKDITSYYIYIKGKITLFVLLIAFIRVYFNRDVKRMIRIFKREGKGKNNG